MRPSRPTVSVVIPTFDRVHYVILAVQSVLAQTHEDLEVVVVDDESTDATIAELETLGDERVVISRHRRCNHPSILRNVGLDLARGDYVAFLDSDDLWRRTKLEQQLAALAASTARWSYTIFDHIDEDGRPIPGNVRPAAVSGWILPQVISTEILALVPTVLAERSLIRDVGPFDEAFRFGEDYDFILRMAAQAETCAVGEALVSIRAHRGRSTAGLPGALGWPEVYQKHQRLVEARDLRRSCRRRRAVVLASHATYYSQRGRHETAISLLRRGLPGGLGRAAWWAAFLKSMARFCFPAPVIRYLGRMMRRR
jgi:GT2 family glycosyltransferase